MEEAGVRCEGLGPLGDIWRGIEAGVGCFGRDITSTISGSSENQKDCVS